MRIALVCVFVGIVAAALGGCSSSEKLPRERWSITVADSGGITGMTNGFTMLESGDIYVWTSLRGNEEMTYKLGSVSRAQALLFKDSIGANIHNVPPGAPGAQKRYLELEIEHTRTRVTWGAPDNPEPPAALKYWYDNLARICESME